MSFDMEIGWRTILQDQFDSEYFGELMTFIKHEYATKNIFPEYNDIFRAFDLCPFEQTKVVILGQDPYHGAGQANGLAFSVNNGVTIPPSLKNIMKEITSDMKFQPNQNGDLSRWAKQGVLLLNSVLTVHSGLPGSHRNRGWERFTDSVILALTQHKSNIVYLLWGNYAKQKGIIIPKNSNLVLESGHPSPFSAKLFHGNNHFTRCNDYLRVRHIPTIDWY